MVLAAKEVTSKNKNDTNRKVTKCLCGKNLVQLETLSESQERENYDENISVAETILSTPVQKNATLLPLISIHSPVQYAMSYYQMEIQEANRNLKKLKKKKLNKTMAKIFPDNDNDV